MNPLRPHINTDYPPNNTIIFEEWFGETWPTLCNTDRELIEFYPTSFWVNHAYGNDPFAKAEAQEFIDSLDRSKKYFIICQYDDGCLVDFKDLDVLQFNMSKKIGVEMPLLCQPHPYKYDGPKKYFANFIGSKTHPVRDTAKNMREYPGYYISYSNYTIEQYCRIMYDSIFTLCYRGYGANSFRIAEAIQYGSIPVYISDEFILPFDADFNDYGILISLEYANDIDAILSKVPVSEVIRRQDNLANAFKKYYSYEGARNQILISLEQEYNKRVHA